MLPRYAVADMTIPSQAKQPGRSPRKKTSPCGQIRFAWLAGVAGDEGTRSASGARSSHTMAIPSNDDNCYSWERQASAEDAGSRLAAGIWPPRAYPCNFCRREFRSAQALGGHMNVHRRDRARLRHSSPQPPSPAFGPILAPSHARSLFQPHDNYHTSLSAQHHSTSLTAIKSPSIAPSRSCITTAATPYASLCSSYPSDNTTRLSLRLQQLASEAAASLLPYPQQQQLGTSSDLLSLMPPPNPDRTILTYEGRAGSKDKAVEAACISSFCAPPTSPNAISTPFPCVRDGITHRRDASTIGEEKQGHCRKNDRNRLLGQIINGKDSLKEVVNAHGARKHLTETASATPCMINGGHAYERSDRSEGDVDLELRLGRKPH